MQRSIGVCLCWSDLEKRRKAIDLFVQRQLEVVDGIPKKVFYECGATPTNCKYNVTAVRNETTGHFELFEMGEHSHPVRANISSASFSPSGFLVDQTTPSCAQSLTQTVTYSNKHIELPSSDDQSKISTQDEKPTTKDQKSCFDTSKHKSSPNPERVLPPKKVLKLTQSNIKIRDFSTESLKSEMTSTTNSPDVLWTSKRKLPAAKKSFNGAENQASLIFDNSFDECIGLLTEDSSKLDTSPVQMEEELKVQMEEEPKGFLFYFYGGFEPVRTANKGK
uniref:WRKY domain-containing protein n=1 Tax=Meloidogyne hapla TaxID=6305 RepID=A0A1I8B3J3_MELHA